MPHPFISPEQVIDGLLDVLERQTAEAAAAAALAQPTPQPTPKPTPNPKATPKGAFTPALTPAATPAPGATPGAAASAPPLASALLLLVEHLGHRAPEMASILCAPMGGSRNSPQPPRLSGPARFTALALGQSQIFPRRLM